MSSHQPIPTMPTHTVTESESLRFGETSEIIRSSHHGLDDPDTHLLVRVFPPCLTPVEISSVFLLLSPRKGQCEGRVRSCSLCPILHPMVRNPYRAAGVTQEDQQTACVSYTSHGPGLQSALSRDLQPWRANLECSFTSPEWPLMHLRPLIHTQGSLK